MAQTSPPQRSANRPQTLPKNPRLVLCPAGRLLSFVTYIFACRPQHEMKRVMCCLCNRLSVYVLICGFVHFYVCYSLHVHCIHMFVCLC